MTNGMPLHMFMAGQLWGCVCRGAEQASRVRVPSGLPSLPALLLSNSLQAAFGGSRTAWPVLWEAQWSGPWPLLV